MDRCMDTENAEKRHILCLHGYQFLLPLTTNNIEQQIEPSSLETYRQFLQLYAEYEVSVSVRMISSV